MAAVRWLLAKDLRILRRSPVLSLLLIVYPAVVAVLIGLALSRGPGLPRVAFLNEIPHSQSVITLGRTRIDINSYERNLFRALKLVPVKTRAQALADVRNGTTLAALIIPSSLPHRLASGEETAYIQVVYNGSAINQSLVQSAIDSKLGQANALLAAQLQKVAGGYIDLLLSGGKLSFLGETFKVLGLRASAQILNAVLAGLPVHSPLQERLHAVANFAKIAVTNLGTSKAVIGAVAAPVVARNRFVNGRRTPLDFFAVAVAVTVSLMFVCLLLASGMLALEREENTFERLRRGLVSAAALLGEKALLAAACAAWRLALRCSPGSASSCRSTGAAPACGWSRSSAARSRSRPSAWRSVASSATSARRRCSRCWCPSRSSSWRWSRPAPWQRGSMTRSG